MANTFIRYRVFVVRFVGFPCFAFFYYNLTLKLDDEALPDKRGAFSRASLSHREYGEPFIILANHPLFYQLYIRFIFSFALFLYITYKYIHTGTHFLVSFCFSISLLALGLGGFVFCLFVCFLFTQITSIHL